MSSDFGSKRVVVGAHYGLRDWMVQRATASLMAIFTFIVWPIYCLPAARSPMRCGLAFLPLNG